MTAERPVIIPEETELTAPYWLGARSGELRLQRCHKCSAVYHPPQPICTNCLLTGDLRWFAASGLGTVYAVTVVEHAAHRAVIDRLPYTVLLVQLDEGPLMISGPPTAGGPPLPTVGSRVAVEFEPVEGTDVVLPRFRGVDPQDS